MVELISTSILAFAATNVDDIFILMMLFAKVPSKLSRVNVVAGQYVGFIALIGLSLLGLLLGFFIRHEYIGLLGLFPIYLGIKEIVESIRGENDHDDFVLPAEDTSRWYTGMLSAKTLSVAIITIANGGDNVGVYIPLFATLTRDQLIIMIAIFLLGTYLLVVAAEYLVTHPLIAKRLKRWNIIIFPLVLILLGIYIIIESGTLSLIM